ncbi:MAG: ABC-type transport auxiliary lipoprotein family protein [Candidatus Acidiferrum sp.]
MNIGLIGVNAVLMENSRCGQRRRAGLLKTAGWILAALPGALLAGCGAARPMQYYQLSVPGDVAQAEPNAAGISLALGPMTSSHLYREDRIVYSSGAEQMGTYEYQRWTEPPAEMISEVLLRQLRASGRYREVYSRRSSTRSDYVLRAQLYDFKEVPGRVLMARVTADWELYDAKTGMTVWSHHYSKDEPVSGKDVPAIVSALDKNVQRAVGEVKAGLDQYFATVPATK